MSEEEHCGAMAADIANRLQGDGAWSTERWCGVRDLLADMIARERADAARQAREMALEEATRLHAEHIEAQLCVAESGMPGTLIIHAIAKTFRSEDWGKAIRALKQGEKPR